MLNETGAIQSTLYTVESIFRVIACKFFDVLKMMKDLKQVIFIGCSARPRSSFRAESRAVIHSIVHTFP
jgi:hypothetical protein